MVRLNGLTLTPTEAREVVRSLSESHGLAPEAAKPVAWYWEKRQIENESCRTIPCATLTLPVIRSRNRTPGAVRKANGTYSVRRATLPGAFAVYHKVDYIKTPGSALAPLGGTTHPKGYYQFEAIGWSNGLDGKPGTADDFSLGPVVAKWSIEEFASHYGDDDKEYVGSLSAEG